MPKWKNSNSTKLVENTKIEKLKCDILSNFQTLCERCVPSWWQRKATNVGYQVKVGKSTNDRKSVWMQNTTTLEGKHLSCKTKTEIRKGFIKYLDSLSHIATNHSVVKIDHKRA